MGVKQSKRSVDITETSTKGEIEGFGNEGKVEKIVDGVMEKVAANGHVENDLQNGGEVHQNGIEPVQNGEAAAVAIEKVMTKESDDSAAEPTPNGQVEANGELNGEPEKTEEEGKKGEDKKDKKDKKEKKEKVVKKRFSFRNFRFSNKDKSKGSKDETSPEQVNEAPVENGTAEGQEEAKSPSVEETAEIAKIEEAPELTPSKLVNSVQDAVGEVAEKTKEMVTAVKSSADDLPPPLPASPPPSEPVGAKLSDDISNTASELLGSFSGKLDDVTSSVSNTFTETIESTGEIIKDAEQIAIETGKQIEEKATSLLKTVEKRAEESLKTVSQTIDDTVGMMENALHLGEKVAAEKETEMQTSTEDATKSLPTEALATKMDETAEKNEDSGAGESLADVPKDLPDEMVEATIEAVKPESPEESKTLPPPPPPVEAPAAE